MIRSLGLLCTALAILSTTQLKYLKKNKVIPKCKPDRRKITKHPLTHQELYVLKKKYLQEPSEPETISML